MADEPITICNGSRMHYKGNVLHRDRGSATEHADGRQEWYLNGRRRPPLLMAEAPALQRSIAWAWLTDEAR